MRSMLVINRSDTLARLFADIFEARGWDVDTCGDRDSAIERLIASKPYDSIVLSYSVPGTNGVDLVGLIRTLEHRRMAAIVMVTGHSERSEAAKAAGADEVLLKPVNPNALIFAVAKHVF